MGNDFLNINLKSELDDLQIEFESSLSSSNLFSENQELINKRIEELDKECTDIYEKIDKYNKEIERLTYKGDTCDLLIAVAGGVLSGVLDIVLVGELGLFKGADEISKKKFDKDLGSTHEKLNKFIIKYAKKKGYKGDRLKGAISFLEKKYPVAQDNIWKGKISSTNYHHLDDLSHHASLLGLLSAIIVQYLRISVFSGNDGVVHLLYVKPTKKEKIEILVPFIISGLIYWIVNLAEKKEVIFDEDLPKPIRVLVEELHWAPIAISILKTAQNWFGHLVSDMGGSKSSAGGGVGIPGLFLSFFKELSVIFPGLKENKYFGNLFNPQKLQEMYGGVEASPLTHKLDLRAELTVVKEQSLPIVINEAFVRTCYFIRHLTIETKDKALKEVDWSKVVPLYNRTIIRMMTVANGTFLAVDLADAAAETAIKHPEACTSVPTFLGTMVMRVNFVGIGRFLIAVTIDVSMGGKKRRDERERAVLMQNMALLTEAKLYYRLVDSQIEMANLHNTEKDMHEAEAEMWKQVEQTEESYQELYKVASKVGDYYAKTTQEMNETFDDIEEDVEEIRKSDPEFLDELLKRLK